MSKTIIWQYCPERFMVQNNNSNIEYEIQHLLNKEMSDIAVEDESIDEEEEDFFKNAKINFWACHTNFDIDYKTFDIIKKTPGIEFIQVKTRYCFLIVVGKLFEFNSVRKNIESQLSCTSEVTSTVQSLRELSKYWACLVKQNGDIEYSASEDDDSIEEVYEDWEYYQSYVKRYGGRIIVSENLEEETTDDDKFKSDI